MKSLLSPFDYIFYRAYSLFHKRNDDISAEKATNIVVILQCFLVLNTFILVSLLTDLEINSQYYNKWLWSLPLVLLIGVFNHRRYKVKLNKDDYSKFQSLWRDEEKIKKKINGILIIVYIVISMIIIPVLYGVS